MFRKTHSVVAGAAEPVLAAVDGNSRSYVLAAHRCSNQSCGSRIVTNHSGAPLCITCSAPMKRSFAETFMLSAAHIESELPTVASCGCGTRFHATASFARALHGQKGHCVVCSDEMTFDGAEAADMDGDSGAGDFQFSEEEPVSLDGGDAGMGGEEDFGAGTDGAEVDAGGDDAAAYDYAGGLEDDTDFGAGLDDGSEMGEPMDMGDEGGGAFNFEETDMPAGDAVADGGAVAPMTPGGPTGADPVPPTAPPPAAAPGAAAADEALDATGLEGGEENPAPAPAPAPMDVAARRGARPTARPAPAPRQAVKANSLTAFLRNAKSVKTVDLAMTGGETPRWYLFADLRPVAVATAAKASERVRAIFATSQFSQAFQIAASEGLTPEVVQDFGFQPVQTEMPATEVVQQNVDQAVADATADLTAKTAEVASLFEKCVGIAALGGLKGIVPVENPLMTAVAAELTRRGDVHATVTAAAIFKAAGEDYLRSILATAVGLTKKSSPALAELSQVVASAEYRETVAPARPAFNLRTAQPPMVPAEMSDPLAITAGAHPASADGDFDARSLVGSIARRAGRGPRG